MSQRDEDSEEVRRNERSSGGRNASLAYELFVLGELMTGPHYGYKLHEIIQRILGPFHRLSWGTLYPLIRRLEQQGLLISELVQHPAGPVEERGPQRKAYRITPAGRERFFSLMLESNMDTRDYADMFAIKLSKFILLSPAQQLVVLQQHRNYLTTLHDYYAAGMDRLRNNPAIDKAELPYLLQVSTYHIHQYNAELTWIDGEIARIAGEGRDVVNDEAKYKE